MSWAVLYARSRRLAVPLLAPVIALVPLWLGNLVWSGGIGLLGILVVTTLGVTAASPGLAGQDHDLDRTASLPWPPRRAAHLAALTAVTVGAAFSLDFFSDAGIPAEVLLRDTIGQVGMLALGVTLFGASFGWSLPFLSLVLAVVPGISGVPPAAWLIQPADGKAALATALLATVLGVTGYTIFGPRRVL
ncbi:hypothetical protein [Amycolatopsis sp. YIM 10]|uniref:hypothetical protein n=1 Tax=Amycolatopsis sp. YIM 10 TaxID=2653857 RepID=UPI0012906241|nr:hypothetical protein [Amycolatopsis sp. YIM 10]QFU89065.1 hypothetical protein YIM_19430 [Amycolatopsis sp. YIM 10]